MTTEQLARLEEYERRIKIKRQLIEVQEQEIRYIEEAMVDLKNAFLTRQDAP